MIPTIDSIIDDILEREGSVYTDHPADLGGPTKYGITLTTLKEYRGVPTTAEDVMNLSEETARNIYWNRYISSVQLHRIQDPYVLSLAVDCSVHHGPQRVVRWLQQIVGVTDDGKFGDVTEVSVNTYEPTKLYWKLLAKRVEFFGKIISHDPVLTEAKNAGFRLQAEFALGWLRRCTDFMEV